MELLCVGGALLSLLMMVFRAMRCSLLYCLLFVLYLSVYKVLLLYSCVDEYIYIGSFFVCQGQCTVSGVLLTVCNTVSFTTILIWAYSAFGGIGIAVSWLG